MTRGKRNRLIRTAIAAVLFLVAMSISSFLLVQEDSWKYHEVLNLWAFMIWISFLISFSVSSADWLVGPPEDM